jgi:hypothetical protein
MDDQIVIKVILLIAIGGLALLVIWPGRGARRLALRRVSLLCLIVIAALLVIFPGLSNSLAQLVGVGRGADLLLYGLTLAFISYVIATRAHHSRIDLQITELARAHAIACAPRPANSPQPTEDGS